MSTHGPEGTHCLQSKLTCRAYIARVFKRPGRCSKVIQEGNLKKKPKPKTQNKTENPNKQKTQSKENLKTHTLLQLSGLRQADEWSSRLYPVYLPGEKGINSKWTPGYQLREAAAMVRLSWIQTRRVKKLKIVVVTLFFSTSLQD